MASRRVRYHAPPIRQRMKFNGQLIGCTDTVLAWLINAETLGGCRVTEQEVRNMSDERHPDPNSPGLNQDQLVQVADRFHVDYRKRTGEGRTSIITALDENRRVCAQLWYADIGGTKIGHAVGLELQTSDRRLRIMDPIKGKYEYMSQDRVFHAMETFARMTGLTEGLRWGASRRIQFISTNQKPAGG